MSIKYKKIENYKAEEFVIFVRDFQNTTKATGAKSEAGKIQYMFALLHCGFLHKFETFPGHIGYNTNINYT